MSKNKFEKQYVLKPKLPRKRKKACIKSQGRKSYWDTIQLAKVTGESPCKFWVNESIVIQTVVCNGNVAGIPTATRFW